MWELPKVRNPSVTAYNNEMTKIHDELEAAKQKQIE